MIAMPSQNSVAGLLLLCLAAWLIFTIPARNRQAKKDLECCRKELDGRLLNLIGPYAIAPQEINGQSTLLQREELIEYNNKKVSGVTFHVISRDADGRYWFHTLHSARECGITQPMTELRVRKALFNKPAAYKNAFAEAPDRKSLSARFGDLAVNESNIS